MNAPDLENIGIAVFSALFLVAGFAILAKNERLISLLHLRRAARSPVQGAFALVLGAVAPIVLITRFA